MNLDQTASVETHELPAAVAESAVAVCPPATPEPATVHRTKLGDFLRGQLGKFVGLDFIKLDGSVRPLNGRLGVRKHLRGGRSTLGSSARPYLVVYDVKKPGYRAVNLATVGEVRAQHRSYTVVG